MAKVLTREQVLAYRLKEVQKIAKKAYTILMNGEGGTGGLGKKEVEPPQVEYDNDSDTYHITMVNSQGDSSELSYQVSKHSEAKLVREDRFEGRFDWAAQTYIKPYGYVELKF
jgi:hypothetical protein